MWKHKEEKGTPRQNRDTLGTSQTLTFKDSNESGTQPIFSPT